VLISHRHSEARPTVSNLALLARVRTEPPIRMARWCSELGHAAAQRLRGQVLMALFRCPIRSPGFGLYPRRISFGAGRRAVGLGFRVALSSLR
jgi:hypothetical protein